MKWRSKGCQLPKGLGSYKQTGLPLSVYQVKRYFSNSGECHHQWCCSLALRIPSWPISDWSQPRSSCLILVLLNIFQLCPLWGQGKRNGCDKGQVCRSSRLLIPHLFSSHGILLDQLNLNSDPCNWCADIWRAEPWYGPQDSCPLVYTPCMIPMCMCWRVAPLKSLYSMARVLG